MSTFLLQTGLTEILAPFEPLDLELLEEDMMDWVMYCGDEWNL